MTTFAEAVTTAATPELTTAPTPAALATLFVLGGSGTVGDYHAVDRNLYRRDNVVARLTPGGAILMGETSLPDVEMNDALIGAIFSSGRTLRRVSDFNNLTSPGNRLAEIREGKVDDFREIASLFGFTYDEADFEAAVRARAFEKSVQEFFTKLEKDEADRVRSAEEKAREERIAAQALGWDRGEGSARNNSVSGAGGGQRLRMAKTQGNTRGRRYDRIETSHAQTTSLNQVRRSWNQATVYWHGNNGEGNAEYNSNYRGSAYLPGGRHIEIRNDYVRFGCQTVYRKEAERFADLMGWPRGRKAAQAAVA